MVQTLSAGKSSVREGTEAAVYLRCKARTVQGLFQLSYLVMAEYRYQEFLIPVCLASWA